MSLFFARHRVRSERCQARSLTSLPMVKPSTAVSAFSGVRFFARWPMTATSSASYSTGPSESRGMTMVSPCAMSALLARYPMSAWCGMSGSRPRLAACSRMCSR